MGVCEDVLPGSSGLLEERVDSGRLWVDVLVADVRLDKGRIMRGGVSEFHLRRYGSSRGCDPWRRNVRRERRGVGLVRDEDPGR